MLELCIKEEKNYSQIVIGVVNSTPIFHLYRNKNKPPAMQVSPQIALASSNGL